MATQKLSSQNLASLLSAALATPDAKETAQGILIHSPFREDKHPSFMIYKDTGVGYDLATGDRFSATKVAGALGVELFRKSPAGARRAYKAPNTDKHTRDTRETHSRAQKRHTEASQRYEYQNLDGSLAYTKTRYDREDGSKRFVITGHKEGDPWLPYHLPILAKNTKAPIMIVEGEKTSDALQAFLADASRSHLATTFGSASLAKKLDIDIFAGRDVMLWPDADLAGMRCMRRLAELLRPIAKSIMWIQVPGAAPDGYVERKGKSEGYDAADYSQAESLELIDRAIETPPAWLAELAKPKAPQKAEPIPQEIADALPDLSEQGAASLFCEMHYPHHAAYVFELSKWFAFNGQYWESVDFSKDSMHPLHRMLDETLAELFARSNDTLDTLDDAYKSSYENKIASSKREASRYRVQCDIIKKAATGARLSIEAFKHRSGFLCVANGYLDIETGAVAPHDASQYSLRCTGGDPFIPWEKHPLRAEFEREVGAFFVDANCNPNKELCDYVGALAGAMLLGAHDVEKNVILYGSTAQNGKSTFLGCMSEAIGSNSENSYAFQVDNNYLDRKKQNDRKDDFINSDGRVFSFLDDWQLDRADLNLEKSAVSGGGIITRPLYAEKIWKEAAFMMWAGTNKDAPYEFMDAGARRRYVFIPFTAQFADNPSFKREFIQKYKGVMLSWIVYHAQLFLQNDRKLPACAIVDDMRKQIENASTIEAFVNEYVRTGGAETFVANVDVENGYLAVYGVGDDVDIDGRDRATILKRLNEALKKKYAIRKTRKTIGGRKVSGFAGITLAAPGTEAPASAPVDIPIKTPASTEAPKAPASTEALIEPDPARDPDFDVNEEPPEWYGLDSDLNPDI